MRAANWLPRGAVASAAATSALAAIVEAWSERWLEGASIKLACVAPLDDLPALSEPWEWRRLSQFLATFAEDGAERMLAYALDCDIANASRSDLDRKLLGDFQQNMLTDLEQALLTALAVKSTGAGNSQAGQIGLVLTCGGEPIATIIAPSSAFSDFIHRHLPPPAENEAAFTSFSEALVTSEIVLGVQVGKATVTLSDLDHLGSGDVLVLDRALQDGVIVAPAHDNSVFLAGDLCNDEGHVAVCVRRIGVNRETFF
jgi:flagellar motor switch/type III secretory pathway protein FliN